MNNLTRFLDERQTDGVMIVSYDYSKAFDRLRHDLILQALQKHEFPDGFRAWIQSYLTGRMQQVVIGDTHSVVDFNLCYTKYSLSHKVIMSYYF